jgi:RND family efflux transporter MFP subunit
MTNSEDESKSHEGSKDHQEEQRHHKPEIQAAPEIAPAPPRRALMFVGVALIVLLVAGLITLLTHTRASRALAKETQASAIPYVAVVHPIIEKPDEDLTLPASLQAYKESPIFARTSGYLVEWYKDIGSKVKKGVLLARIDTPEVDQELSQTRAAREQIAAQLSLAKISADRYQSLRKSDSVSQQEADQQISGYQQAVANLNAADANVRRLEQLESFKNVYAPFSGVLTRRNVDPGALINAGAGVSGKELFDIAEVDPIRVFVNVPQTYASIMRSGLPAWVELQERPGEKFRGIIARTADALDPATRTLVVEVDVPNHDGKLLPGSYGQVHFEVAGKEVRRMTIPVNAMLFRAEGSRVAVVGHDGKVQLRPISIGRDYGSTLEILGGVNDSDTIIINPSDSLEEGQKVNIASQNTNADGSQQGGNQPPANQQSTTQDTTPKSPEQLENQPTRTSDAQGNGRQQGNQQQENQKQGKKSK